MSEITARVNGAFEEAEEAIQAEREARDQVDKIVAALQLAARDVTDEYNSLRGLSPDAVSVGRKLVKYAPKLAQYVGLPGVGAAAAAFAADEGAFSSIVLALKGALGY